MAGATAVGAVGARSSLATLPDLLARLAPGSAAPCGPGGQTTD
jgi:hypothetical protein